MPLLDENMLPKRVRTMKPMDDLLQAEEVMLELLELYIQQMLADASVNNNKPLTKEAVESIATSVSHNPAHVDEFPDELTIHIVISRNNGKMVDRETIINTLDRLLPAHLRYRVVFQLQCSVGISYTRRIYLVSADLCGGYDNAYSGEYPARNMAGKIRSDGLLIETIRKEKTFTAPLAGTFPYRNMAGKIQEHEILLETVGEPFLSPCDMGQNKTGEYPERSMAGRVSASGVQVTAQAEGHPVKYPLTGTEPERNMSGSTEGVVVLPHVNAERYPFFIDYCQEDDYCGE